MRTVIDTPTAFVEVTVDGAPMLRLCLVVRDHTDELERTRVAALLKTEDVIGLHALLGAHLRTQGVQP